MLAVRRARRPLTILCWASACVAAVACASSSDTPDDERDAGVGAGSALGGSAGAASLEPDAGAGGSGAGTGGTSSNGGSAGTSSTGNGGSAGSGAASNGGSGGSGGQSSGPPCDAVEEVFLPSCGMGSCHSNKNATIGDFAVGRAEAEALVDVPSRRNASCGVFIDSSDPSESLLLRKLTGDFDSSICGGKMPLLGRDLTSQEIACVASWLGQFER